jgi:hypothetical protein
MDAKSQSGINFSYLMSGYDLMESAGKHWMEAVKRVFPETAESDGNQNVQVMESFKAWQQWYEDRHSLKNGCAQDMQTLATACIDHQKRCSELTLAWWKCSLKALRAIGGGMRNGEHPAQIMKTCMALSEEYVRSCADFLAAQSEALAESAASIPVASEKGTVKQTSARAKAS